MALEENARDFNLTYYAMDDKRQGIVHIIGPEQVSSDSEGEIGMGCLIWRYDVLPEKVSLRQGFTLPGSVIVCGDSHTATHGAFGALAFGIGTSEVEHVLATQTLVQVRRPVRLSSKSSEAARV